MSVTSEPSAASIVDDAVDAGFGEVTVRFAGPSGFGEYPVPPGAPPEVIAEEVEEMFRAVDTTVPPVESLTVVSTADRTDLAAVVAATETRLSGVADDLVGVRVLLSVPAVDDAVEVSDVATALDDITTVGDLAELTVSTPDAAVSADTSAPSEGAGPARAASPHSTRRLLPTIGPRTSTLRHWGGRTPSRTTVLITTGPPERAMCLAYEQGASTWASNGASSTPSRTVPGRQSLSGSVRTELQHVGGDGGSLAGVSGPDAALRQFAIYQKIEINAPASSPFEARWQVIYRDCRYFALSAQSGCMGLTDVGRDPLWSRNLRRRGSVDVG